MDEKQERACIIRWLTHLVRMCSACDAEIVVDVLGYRSYGELQSKAQRIIRELAERGR